MQVHIIYGAAVTSLMHSITSFMAFAITSFCVLADNDVDLTVKWCLRLHRKMMLCPCGHKYTRKKDYLSSPFFLWSFWPESNRWPHPYQGCALPTEPQKHHSFFILPKSFRFVNRKIKKSLKSQKLFIIFLPSPSFFDLKVRYFHRLCGVFSH